MTEGVETYPLILKRLLGILSKMNSSNNVAENDANVEDENYIQFVVSPADFAYLVRALLHSLRRTQLRDLRILIGQCLGSIGFVDFTATESSASKADEEQQPSSSTKGGNLAAADSNSSEFIQDPFKKKSHPTSGGDSANETTSGSGSALSIPSTSASPTSMVFIKDRDKVTSLNDRYNMDL
jgi:hypothetical protein